MGLFSALQGVWDSVTDVDSEVRRLREREETLVAEVEVTLCHTGSLPC